MGQGAVYLGDMERGEPHGTGQVFFSNDGFLEASFKHGHVDCKDGILIEPTGNFNYLLLLLI